LAEALLCSTTMQSGCEAKSNSTRMQIFLILVVLMGGLLALPVQAQERPRAFTLADLLAI
jgi:hypothetical protein